MEGFDSLLKQMQKGYFVSSLTHTSPFVWPENKGSISKGPEKATGALPLLMWWFNSGLVSVNVIFVGIRCLQTGTDPTASNVVKMYMQFAFVFYFYAFLLQVSNLVCRNDVAVFVRRYMTSIRGIGTTSPGSFGMVLKLCPKFLFVIRTWVSTVPLFGACLVYLNPNSPEMWSSVFESPEKLSWVCRVLFVTVQAYLMLLLTDVGILWVSSMFPFILFTMDLLKFLR